MKKGGHHGKVVVEYMKEITYKSTIIKENTRKKKDELQRMKQEKQKRLV